MMIPIQDMLALGAHERKFEANEVIFKEGSTCQYYHQLVSGRVRWVNVNEQGKEYLQELISPGESFGELPLFDDEPYAANSIAETNCTTIKLKKESFLKMLSDKPELHFRFSKLLVQRLRYKFLILKEFAYSAPEKRVESLFNYLLENDKHIDADSHLQLTRQQIAEMTGLRVETVIRVIRSMNELHKINIQKGKVYFALNQ
jgi:CRP/FNR family cyclic AMP-dependent transcriptional regulator